MKAQHTPGPWHIGPLHRMVVPDRPCNSLNDGHVICQLHGHADLCGNARLIAAAPELADALERLLSCVEDAEPQDTEITAVIDREAVNAARAVLLRALDQG